MRSDKTTELVPSLVAFDLDGTTIDFETEDLHPRVQAALDRVHALGAATAVVSGRPLQMLRPIQAHPWVGWLITMNGSLILRSSDEKVLFAHAISRADAEAAFDTVADLQPGAGVITEKGLYQERQLLNYMLRNTMLDDPGREVDADVLKKHFPDAVNIESAREFAASTDEGLYKLQFSFPNPDIRDEAHARLDVLDRFELADMGVMEIEVTARGINKGTALEQLYVLTGIEQGRAVAFGDSGNDIEMAGHVGTLVAVDNATPEFKAVVDEVCPSVSEQGVAQWLEENVCLR